MADMDAYVKKFHNLGGSTVSEHQRNFNNFRRSVTEEFSETEISDLLLLLKPQNIQEEVFLVRLLNYYKQYKQLLQILVSGNKIFKLTLKNKEFVRFIAQEYPPEAFAEELCPQLSFVSRISLINKLGFVLESGDNYFKAIRARYGFRIVVNLLPTCSESLITSVIKENYVRLNDKQLIHIYKRFPNILELYLKTTDTKLNTRKKLVKYFLQNDIKTLAALKEKFGKPKLGKIGLLKLMKYNKEEIIKHPNHYQDHKQIIYRHLSDDEYKRYFKNIFPKSIDDFYLYKYNIQACIGLVSKDKRYELFVGTYEELYGTKYEEESEYFLQTLPLKDRLKFNLEKREYLMGVEEGIERLKSKIQLTFDTNMKIDLFSNIIKCCKVNNDTEALLRVLEYFSKRHKNENSEIRLQFLNNILDSFDLNKLSDEHWKYINEILLIFEINDEIIYSKYPILEQNILRNIELELDFKHLLKEYMKDKVNNSYYIFLGNHPKALRQCILQMNELVLDIPVIKPETAAIGYFNTIHQFNLSHPEMKISYFDFPDMLNILLQYFDTYNSDDYFFKLTTKALICNIPTDLSKMKLWEKLVECFLSKLNKDTDEVVINFVLKKKPNLIQKYASNILKHLPKFNNFYYELNKMHYAEIRKAFEQQCIAILEDPARLEEVPGTIQFLSYRKDFFKLIEKFKPQPDCKLDLYGQNVKVTLNIQKAILKAFKNLRIINNVWEEILYYAKGDYLQYALEPLYNMLYRLEENKLHAPLQQLLDRSASVRKHGIYLTTILGSLKDIRLILIKTGKSEKNLSVQKFIFKCTLSALCNTADETLWNIFHDQLPLINENDMETFEMLLKPKKIPRTFFAKYISEVWVYLKSKHKDHELKMINYLSFRIIEQLPNSFCDEVLAHTIEKSNIENSFNYIYDYLVRSKDLLQSRLEHFINSLHKYMKEPTNEKHKIIYNLLENICVKLVKAKVKFPEETLTFSQKLLENLSKFPINLFEIELFLQAIIRHDPNDINNLTALILERQKKFIEKFGPEIITYHANIEKELLNHFYTTMEGDEYEKILLVVESLMRQAQTYHVKLLVILLLPDNITKNVGYLKRKESLINELKKEEREVVYLFLDKYITTLRNYTF